ncbi:unnamed protein product [Staurois parvus]|uniref:Uncharacterized protein n=1 Tax=Staurois parvus TaxID=386267 RepID=A0ABN9BGD0_9NEOB|nr:unnamed protein product [Staurois parvus]
MKKSSVVFTNTKLWAMIVHSRSAGPSRESLTGTRGGLTTHGAPRQ